MREHAKEPWETYVDEADSCCRIATKRSDGVTEDLGVIYDPNDARRIVACVNSCAGIPTEFLEREQYLGTAAFSLRDQLEQQRDELLTALVEILDAHNGGFLGHGHMDAARAAIAKVKREKK